MADANGHETLTSLSWERHGQNDDRSKGTVIMGSTSGRGGRRSSRRAGGDGTSAARRGYTSLISDTQRGGYRPDDGYGDHRGYAHTGGYRPPNGFRERGGPPLRSGFDQDPGDGFDSGGARAG